MALRKAAWALGLRYRLHLRTPVGRADLKFTGKRLAVFVDGCFWHGCPAHYTRPRTRVGFWSKKLADNTARDRRQTAELESLGWTVLRIWECGVSADPLASGTRIRDLYADPDLAQTPAGSAVEVSVVPGRPGWEEWSLESLRGRESHRTQIRRRLRTALARAGS
jgi:DNA mismatch endonuclease (patch repair protein)